MTYMKEAGSASMHSISGPGEDVVVGCGPGLGYWDSWRVGELESCIPQYSSGELLLRHEQAGIKTRAWHAGNSPPARPTPSYLSSPDPPRVLPHKLIASLHHEGLAVWRTIGRLDCFLRSNSRVCSSGAPRETQCFTRHAMAEECTRRRRCPSPDPHWIDPEWAWSRI